MYQSERFARSAGEIAREAYPDVRTLTLKLGVPEAYAAVLEEARGMGWEIVTTEASAGIVEATADLGSGLVSDDVAIRVRQTQDGAGAEIDMRSTSRGSAMVRTRPGSRPSWRPSPPAQAVTLRAVLAGADTPTCS